MKASYLVLLALPLVLAACPGKKKEEAMTPPPAPSEEMAPPAAPEGEAGQAAAPAAEEAAPSH